MERLAVVIVAEQWSRTEDVVSREATPSVIHETQADVISCSKDTIGAGGRGLTCAGPGTAAVGRLFLRRTFAV